MLGNVIEYLDDRHVHYATIRHPQAFTAQESAASAHIPGKILAKTVIVKMDGRMAMAVLPASYQIDFLLLKAVTGADQVELATEDDFKDLFPHYEIGAMPPFGNLFGLEVFVAESLAENEDIAFNGGSHVAIIKMAYQDFVELVHPTVIRFSYHH